MLYLKQGSISEWQESSDAYQLIGALRWTRPRGSPHPVEMFGWNHATPWCRSWLPAESKLGQCHGFTLMGLIQCQVFLLRCVILYRQRCSKVSKGVPFEWWKMVKNGETIPPFISLCPISSQDIKAVFLFVSHLEMGRGQTPSIHQYSHVGLGVLHDLVPSIHQLFCAFSACCHCCLRIFALLLEPICYPYMLGKLHLTFRGRGTVKQTF